VLESPEEGSGSKGSTPLANMEMRWRCTLQNAQGNKCDSQFTTVHVNIRLLEITVDYGDY